MHQLRRISGRVIRKITTKHSMASREFPAPPNLSELLRFFESDEGKARVNRQNEASRLTSQKKRQQISLSKQSGSGNVQPSSLAVRRAVKPPAVTSRRPTQPSTTNSKSKSVRDDKVPTTSQGWNASTLLPPAPVNSLRHQLLSRTYQPPAPVYVVPSEASELLDRLAKGTISSRSKLKAPSDPARDRQSCSVKSNDKSSTSPADTRGRDAIQTLLFYRKEVERRRRLDTNDSRHFE